MLESDRTAAIAYDAEGKSTILDPTGIIVKNNAVGTADTVVVPGVAVGDIVKVYSVASGGTAIGTITATVAGSVTVTIPQIGAVAGNIYVSRTSKTLLESDRTAAIAYDAEGKSTILDATGIIVKNNAVGTVDTVVVPGVAVGDIVKVYSVASGGTAIGTITATVAGSVTVTIPQIGAVAGNIYVSRTSKTLLESDRTAAIAYDAEGKSILDPTGIIVKNNAVGTADAVVVPGVAVGDIVKVYSVASGGTAIGTITATVAGSVTVTIPQIGAVAGNIYVSRTSKTLLESDRTAAIAYDAEGKSTILDATGIIVKNNAVGTADTVSCSRISSRRYSKSIFSSIRWNCNRNSNSNCIWISNSNYSTNWSSSRKYICITNK